MRRKQDFAQQNKENKEKLTKTILQSAPIINLAALLQM